MKKALGDDALNQIFREARPHSVWLDKPVSDEILRQLYDLKINVGAQSPLVIQLRSNQTSLRHNHVHLHNPAPPTHGQRARKHVK